MITAGELLARHKRASAKRGLWDSYLKDCFRYTAPNRDTFHDQTVGQSKHREVYDSTAILASKYYVSVLQARLMPAWSEWSLLSPGSDYANAPEKEQIAEALESITKTVFRHVNHSNFYQSLPEALRDMTVSTGAIRIDMGTPDDPFHCTTDTLANLNFEPGPHGSIENVWRCPRIPLSAIERDYPGIRMPDKWQKIKAKNPLFEPKIVEASLYFPEKDEYWSYAVAQDEGQIVWQQRNGKGPGANPWVVFRDDVIPGEVLGRGPAMHALNDVLTLNKVVEFELRNAALAVAGAWTGITDGVLNPYTAMIEPGVIIPVGSNSNTNPSLKPLERSGDFNISNLQIERLQANIKQAFLNSMRKADGPVKSATEIAIDDRELLMEQHANFGRLQTELVNKVMARFVYILSQLGMIPALKIDGREITLKHTSPLSRVQDNEELQRIERYFALGNATVGPEVMMLGTKMDSVPEAIGKRLGIPQSLLNSEAEREQIKANLQQAAQQVQEQQANAG